MLWANARRAPEQIQVASDPGEIVMPPAMSASAVTEVPQGMPALASSQGFGQRFFQPLEVIPASQKRVHNIGIKVCASTVTDDPCGLFVAIGFLIDASGGSAS